MNNEEFLRLTTLYLEDAINADDLELLNRELTSSADRVQQFNDLRLVTGLIKEHGCPVESLSSTNDSFVAAPYKLQHHNFDRHNLALQSREWFWLQWHHSLFSYLSLTPNHNGAMTLQQLPDLRTHPMRNGEAKNDRGETGSTKAKYIWRPALHG